MTQSTSTTEEQPEYTIQSPNRPFPLSAKQALRETAAAVTYEEPTAPGEPWLAHVDEVPADEILEQYELTVDRDPVEVWESDSDERVTIYPQRVTVDGYEGTISPAEAKERVREEDRFSPIEMGDS
ncbi:hypothetical protein ACFQDD_00445 [Halorubrum pallidum]|uniref:Uncharacterized protein n=1 Tax=Halorubrum pallidum TaxID=1526114 RepID=A0ABD5T3T1_9EURY